MGAKKCSGKNKILKPEIGDLVSVRWCKRDVLGIVLDVIIPDYHIGVNYTVELLEINGRKFMYDIDHVVNSQDPDMRIISSYENG